MKIRKYLMLFLIMVLVLFSLAFQATDPDNQWRIIFEWVIGIFVLLLGAPLTQILKNWLNVKDKLALLLTAVVATILAIAELFLTHALEWQSFSLENFPFAFSVVMTVATLYYNLLKGSDSLLGRGLLLPLREPDHDGPI